MAHRPYLYFHGGPGMNSVGEQALLAPVFASAGLDVVFWSEPSSTGPGFNAESAFSGWLASARGFLQNAAEQFGGPLPVVAHSFAAQGICRIAFDRPELFESLTLVAPVLATDAWLRNVLRIAAADFEKSDAAKAQQVLELLASSRKTFDESMQAAFALAAQDAALFTNYWQNTQAMANYFAVWQQQGKGLDAFAFFSVLRDLSGYSALPTRPGNFKKGVRVILGKHDRVSSAASEIEECHRIFGDLTFHTFAESGHFPHLEESDRLIEVLVGKSVDAKALNRPLISPTAAPSSL